MKISFHDDSSGRYWAAATDKDGYDADGPTVEAALAGLVVALERALGEDQGSA